MTDDDVTAAAVRLAPIFAAFDAGVRPPLTAQHSTDLVVLAQAYLALAPVPPDVAAAAERLAAPNWIFGTTWDGHAADAVLRDGQTVARWVRDGRRAAGGGA